MHLTYICIYVNIAYVRTYMYISIHSYTHSSKLFMEQSKRREVHTNCHVCLLSIDNDNRLEWQRKQTHHFIKYFWSRFLKLFFSPQKKSISLQKSAFEVCFLVRMDCQRYIHGDFITFTPCGVGRLAKMENNTEYRKFGNLNVCVVWI